MKSNLDRIVTGAGSIVILIAVLALVGWAIDLEVLRSFAPGLIAMQANAACCFILAGVAAILVRPQSGGRVVTVFAGVMIATALVTIAEYGTGWNPGLDILLFNDPASLLVGLPPGRMAFATAVAFLLTGVAILLVQHKGSSIPAQVCLFAAIHIPLFAVLAYLFGDYALTHTNPYASLAINSALCFGLLTGALLCRCTAAGPMAVLVSSNAGGTTLRRLLPLCTLITLGLGFASFFGYRHGFYSITAEMVLFTVATLLVTACAIWINGWLLDRAEAARRLEADWLRLTLDSIGDAVIATDREGTIQFLNPIAESLTGWSSAESASQPLSQVYQVIHASSRETVEDPVAIILREVPVTGLPRRTILIARDGSEHPIEETAAPIRDRLGAIIGVVLVFQDVSAKRKAEVALEKSEERYRTLFQSMDEGFCVIEVIFDAEDKPVDYRFLEMNPVFEEKKGLQGAAGKTIREIAPDHDDQWFSIYGKVAMTGEQVHLVEEARALGRWFEMSAFRVGGTESRKVAVLFNDISSRVRAEKERERLHREVEAERGRLADVFQSAPSFMCVFRGPTHVFERTNDRYVDLVGRQDLIGRTVRDALPEVDGQGYFEALDTVYRTGELIAGSDVQVTLVREPGRPAETRYVDFVYQPLRNSEGEVTGVLVQGVDITDRKLAEAEVRIKTERLNLLVENTRDYAVMITDPDGVITEWEGGAERITGFTPSEMLGQLAHRIFTPEDRARARPEHEMSKAEATGRAEDKRWHLRKDGTRFFADGVMNPLFDESGKLHGFGKVFKDATWEKLAEESTRRKSGQLQKLADIANRINSAHDVQAVIGVVASESLILFDAHQASISLVLDLTHPQPVSVIANSTKNLQGATPVALNSLSFYEFVNEWVEPVRLTRDEMVANDLWQRFGTHTEHAEIPNGWLAAPLVGRNGRNMGLIQLTDRDGAEFTADDEAVLIQLTQLTAIAVQNARLYEELRTNDERKDEFLAMLAHELRNPLAAISNAVKLTSKTDLREHHDWSMEVITRQMLHLSRLIDDLMDVSRITRGKIDLKREVLDVTTILESAAATVRSLAEERKHTLTLDIEGQPLWVLADPTRLEQVVVNLLNNAAKYSENEGSILLAARCVSSEVVVSVKDRGIGIPPDRLPEMFELFAQGDRSLARSEGGLGIGLTVVKKLVEMHGGTITATSEGVGAGSEFVIRLPAVENPAISQMAPVAPPAKEASQARILVVDDNEDTARGMSRLLKLLGHEVRMAHNGPEAIATAREFQPEFILLDIGLPGMNGYEVATHLRTEECCREVLIVAISGYGQEEDRRRSREAGFNHHLTKPLDHDALIELLGAGQKTSSQ